MFSTVMDLTWILTGIIGLLTLVMVRHIMHVRSLPPGPFPLPFLGNILAFRGKGNEFPIVLSRLHKKYKDIFTVWLGYRPTVFVCNWELCHEALVVKRNDFSGRVRRHTAQIFLGGHEDVVFGNFDPTWEALRKLLSTALRKYTVSEHLAELVSDVVDSTTERVLKDHKPTEANSLMYHIIYNILASSSFGQRFEIDDPKFVDLRKNNDKLNQMIGVGLPTDAVPFLKPFYRQRAKEVERLTRILATYIKDNFKDHERTYQSGDIRDFTDAVLAAREEAEMENKDILEYFTEGNLVMTLQDLFGAGTDTTRIFLLWIFLIICDKPEIQKRMQAEIDKNIGSRMPVQKDKSSCPYVQAVMTEVLRFRPVIDFSLEHSTTCDTELAGCKIPKDTSCLFYIKGPHFDPKYWDEPETFKPERFLDEDGNFTSVRMTSYLPFGLGRRSCPGEKLALADSFLAVARLLQHHNFELEGGPGSVTIEPGLMPFGREPVKYNLVLKKRVF